MWGTIKALLGSKKAMMAILASLAYAGGKFGLEMNAGELAGVVGPLWVYVFGQGIADLGKGRAEAEAASGE